MTPAATADTAADTAASVENAAKAQPAPSPHPLAQDIHAVPAAYFRWKGLLDRVLAGIMLAPALPVIGVLMALVRLTSPGPAIFRQRRVGKGGRCFEMLKLRSMRSDAEKDGAAWSQPGDSRVTFLGRILRKLHLDELPQLVNVLRGEMSLIGPRPERPEFVHVLAEQIPGYCDRLAILPGVTGLAQVNLPPDSGPESVCKKLILDREYVYQGSLWLDARILLCTAGRMVGVPLRRVLGLRRRVQLPEVVVEARVAGENPGHVSLEEVISSHRVSNQNDKHARSPVTRHPK